MVGLDQGDCVCHRQYTDRIQCSLRKQFDKLDLSAKRLSTKTIQYHSCPISVAEEAEEQDRQGRMCGA